MIGSALPYLVAIAGAVALILCEEWLQRRTGQSWWAINQLGWAVISAVLAMLTLYFGHPVVALVAAALAVLEVALARLSWVKRGAASPITARRASGLGPRGWIFVFVIGGVWTLVERWGLSWVSSGVVAFVLAVVVFRVWRPRSPGAQTPWNGEQVERWQQVGADPDRRRD
jgi:hypothetical protein